MSAFQNLARRHFEIQEFLRHGLPVGKDKWDNLPQMEREFHRLCISELIGGSREDLLTVLNADQYYGGPVDGSMKSGEISLA